MFVMFIGFAIFMRVLAMSGVYASLTHSMLFPNIVELNTSSIPFEVTDTAQSFGRVKFNGVHAFECSKLPSSFVSELSRDKFDALEKVVSLFGACWDVDIDVSDSSILRVCMGDKVYQYRMNPDESRSSLRPIGVSDPQFSVTKVPEGIDEVFTGSIEKVHVRYICDHTRVHISLEKSSEGSEYTKLVRIFSYVFCPELSESERQVLLTYLPGLRVFTNQNFWEYQFKYPDELLQIHSDFDPLLNERYNLGSIITSLLEVVPVTSLDPEDVYMTKQIRYTLEGGTLCERHGDVDRQTTVVFQCPSNWQDLTAGFAVPAAEGWTVFKIPDIGEKKFVARIANVQEIRVCEYEYTIETNVLCIDSQFIPKFIAVENQFIHCHSSN